MDIKKINNPIYKKLRDEKSVLWSFSRCNGYTECPYSYYLSKTRRHDSIDNVYNLSGSLAHDIMEKHYTEEPMSPTKMEEVFSNGMLRILSNGYRFMSNKIEVSYLENMRHYFATFETDVRIKECEKFVALPLWKYEPSLKDQFFQGWCDSILYNNDGTVSIGDFKTSTIFVGKDLIKKSKQLILYAIAYEYLYKTKVKSIFFDFMKYAEVSVNGKKKIVERKELPFVTYDVNSLNKAYKFVELTDDIKKDAIDWLITTIKTIENDTVFDKGSECGANNFACKFICGFRNICDKK